MKTNNNTSLFQRDQVMESLKQSFVKLNPKIMVKNPVMFTVEISTLIMFIVTLFSATNDSQGSFAYNLLVFIILLVTLLFANFAEAIAEARGKAQADSLRKTREETPAKLNVNGQIKTVSSSQLKKGDVFECEAGDVIPADGEIIEGLASIDESAITGESAPVIRGRRRQEFRYRWYESTFRPYQSRCDQSAGRELLGQDDCFGRRCKPPEDSE